jgi:dienelactone hydrolase
MHWLEPQEHTSNRTQFLPEALTLAKEGVVSLLPDGFWSTDPKRWSADPTFWWKSDAALDTELSKRQVVEIRRSLDVLLGQPGADVSKLLYVGHDFGAMYGILVAAVDRRPKGYVLMAGTTTFSEWFLFGSKLDKKGESQYIKEMSPLDPIKYVGQTAPADLLFQFAHADYYVPERTAHMLYDAASEPKSIRWYDAGHNVQHDQALPDRLEWLRARLGN